MCLLYCSRLRSPRRDSSASLQQAVAQRYGILPQLLLGTASIAAGSPRTLDLALAPSRAARAPPLRRAARQLAGVLAVVAALAGAAELNGSFAHARRGRAGGGTLLTYSGRDCLRAAFTHSLRKPWGGKPSARLVRQLQHTPCLDPAWHGACQGAACAAAAALRAVGAAAGLTAVEMARELDAAARRAYTLRLYGRAPPSQRTVVSRIGPPPPPPPTLQGPAPQPTPQAGAACAAAAASGAMSPSARTAEAAAAAKTAAAKEVASARAARAAQLAARAAADDARIRSPSGSIEELCLRWPQPRLPLEPKPCDALDPRQRWEWHEKVDEAGAGAPRLIDYHVGELRVCSTWKQIRGSSSATHVLGPRGTGTRAGAARAGRAALPRLVLVG